jgi:hypothetical protein
LTAIKLVFAPVMFTEWSTAARGVYEF